MSSLLQYLFIIPIRLYQWAISPVLSNVFGMRCRYEPSCSHYMVGCIKEWGIIGGLWLGIKRIGRCHPWGGFGPDPVPANPKKSKIHDVQTSEKK